MEQKSTDAAAIIRELAPIKSIDVGGVPSVVLPPGWTVEPHPELLPAPMRTKRIVTAHDVAGFISYTNRFKIDSVTALFAALEPEPALVGMIDYHAPSLPSHCEHIVKCAMAVSEEWKRWGAKNTKPMSQKEFGVFLEDNQADVEEPHGSELLDLALNFSTSRTLEFRSSTRLNNTTSQLQFMEGEKAGEMQLPLKIKLAIPVFRGESRYIMMARLKHQLDGPKLSIWYELERPDIVKDTAYTAVLERIAADTGIQVFRGAC